MNLRKLLFKLEKHGDGKAPQPRADLDLIGTASVQHRGLKPKVIWLYESHLASPSTSLCLRGEGSPRKAGWPCLPLPDLTGGWGRSPDLQHPFSCCATHLCLRTSLFMSWRRMSCHRGQITMRILPHKNCPHVLFSIKPHIFDCLVSIKSPERKNGRGHCVSCNASKLQKVACF